MVANLLQKFHDLGSRSAEGLFPGIHQGLAEGCNGGLFRVWSRVRGILVPTGALKTLKTVSPAPSAIPSAPAQAEGYVARGVTCPHSRKGRALVCWLQGGRCQSCGFVSWVSLTHWPLTWRHCPLDDTSVFSGQDSHERSLLLHNYPTLNPKPSTLNPKP